MVESKNESDLHLSKILKVTSNITRRMILTTLVQEGPSRVTDLAKHYAMSLNAVSKHIKLLEAVGLISRKKIGREHYIEANLEPIKEIDKWFSNLRSIWVLQLEKLEKLILEDYKMSELSLNVSHTIKAAPETVYNAWLDPALLAKFMIAGEGMTISKAETDPREGGRFSIVMVAGDQELPHGGEYQKLDPFTKIIFTWESPFSVDESTVTLNFTKITDGTKIDLFHIKFVDEESRDNHLLGWESILGHLEKAVS